MRFPPPLVALAVAVVLRMTLPALATGDPPEQRVVPVTPGAEQRVEPIAPGAEQHVEAIAGDGMQQVSGGTKSPVRRGAERAGKVVVGVLAAGISIGAMIASLLFL